MKNYFLIDTDGNLVRNTNKGEEAFDWIFHEAWGAIYVIPNRITDSNDVRCYKQEGFNKDTHAIFDECLRAL